MVQGSPPPAAPRTVLAESALADSGSAESGSAESASDPLTGVRVSNSMIKAEPELTSKAALGTAIVLVDTEPMTSSRAMLPADADSRISDLFARRGAGTPLPSV